MKLAVFPGGAPFSVEILEFPVSSKRAYACTAEGNLFELKAAGMAPGSMFISETVVQDGTPLIAVPVDPILLLIQFEEMNREIMELGLDDNHEELQGMSANWDHLKRLAKESLKLYGSSRQFMSSWTSDTSVQHIVNELLSEEKINNAASTRLFDKIARERQFSQRWSLSGPTTQLLAKAFSLDALSEHIPPLVFKQVCTHLGLTPSVDVPLARSKAETKTTENGKLPAPAVVPKKRAGKAQVKLDDEAKTSQRITSFFKPKP